MDYPYWYKLLYNWCILRNRTGLTLPFIIGAQSCVKNSDISLEDIDDFIEKVSANSYSYSIIAKVCPDLKEAVLGLTERGNKYSTGIYIQDNLYIATSLSEYAKSEEELINYLKQKYWDRVSEGQFSKNNGNWDGFNAYDWDLIIESKFVIIE